MPLCPTDSSEDTITVEQASPLIGRKPAGTYRAIRLEHIPRGVWWRIGRDIYLSRGKLLAWRDAGGAVPAAESNPVAA